MTKNDRDLIDRLRNDVTIIYENENLGEIFVSSPRKIELEAADALEARGKRIDDLESRFIDKEARIAELEDKLKDEEYVSKDTNEMFHEVRDELKVSLLVNDKLLARIAELEAALKPMTAVVEFLLPFGDLSDEERAQWGEIIRAARAALEKKND